MVFPYEGHTHSFSRFCSETHVLSVSTGGWEGTCLRKWWRRRTESSKGRLLTPLGNKEHSPQTTILHVVTNKINWFILPNYLRLCFSLTILNVIGQLRMTAENQELSRTQVVILWLLCWLNILLFASVTNHWAVILSGTREAFPYSEWQSLLAPAYCVEMNTTLSPQEGESVGLSSVYMKAVPTALSSLPGLTMGSLTQEVTPPAVTSFND